MRTLLTILCLLGAGSAMANPSDYAAAARYKWFTEVSTNAVDLEDIVYVLRGQGKTSFIWVTTNTWTKAELAAVTNVAPAWWAGRQVEEEAEVQLDAKLLKAVVIALNKRIRLLRDVGGAGFMTNVNNAEVMNIYTNLP